MSEDDSGPDRPSPRDRHVSSRLNAVLFNRLIGFPLRRTARRAAH